MLARIESYLVRRFIVGLSNKNYNNHFLALLLNVQQSGPSVQGVERFLQGKDDDHWPQDAEVRNTLTQQPTYQQLKPRGVRLLLEALERSLVTSKQEQVHFEETLSIEHVLPQRWRKHWPIPQGSVSRPDPELWRDRIVHNLGNLTLVGGKLNSALSNGPYARKREELAHHSRLRLNLIFQSQETWDEGVIETRAHALTETILALWPRPAALQETAFSVQGVPSQVLRWSGLDAFIADVKARPLEGFLLEELAADGLEGVQWIGRTWSRLLKHQVLWSDTAEGGRYTLLFREDYPSQDARKASVRNLVQKVADEVELAFVEQLIERESDAVRIHFAGDSATLWLRQALERLFTLTVPRVERWRAQQKPASAASSDLNHRALSLESALPMGWFVQSEDMSSDRLYRRIQHALWPRELYFALESERWAVYCTLSKSDPRRAAILALWMDLETALESRLSGLGMALVRQKSNDGTWISTAVSPPSSEHLPEAGHRMALAMEAVLEPSLG